MPQRLPIVNSDDGQWGTIIRQFLMKEHFNDDTDNTLNGQHQNITIKASTGAAGTAPITFNSGTNLSTVANGAMEYNGTYFYLTTGSTRRTIAAYDDSSGAAGDLHYRDASGNFVRLAAGTAGQTLKSSSSALPSWSAPFTQSTQAGTSYTIGATDTVIFANAASNNVTITLPAASSFAGYRFYVKRIDNASNTVTIAMSGSDTLDGATSTSLPLQYQAIGIVSNGSAWYIL